MKIIGIIGSPRIEGNTEILVKECISEINSLGIETEIIHLGKIDIKMCDGCLKCDETGLCHIKDGMNEINNKLSLADGFVFATPARWRLLSGNLKVFFDRTNPLAVSKKLAGKKAIVIAVGQTFGRDAISIKKAAESVAAYCKDNEMDIVGYVHGENALNEGEIIENKKALIKSREMGKLLVSQCQ